MKKYIIFCLVFVSFIFNVTKIQSQTHKVDKLIVQASDAYKDKEYNKAIMLLQQAVIISPDNPVIYRGLSKSYSKINKLKEAIDALKTSIAHNKDLDTKYSDYFELINFYISNSQESLALATCQEALNTLTNVPNDQTKVNLEFKLKSWLFDLYGRNGQIDNAISVQQSIIQSVPTKYELYIDLGVLYLRKNKIKEAEAAAKMALEINPKAVSALNLQSDIFIASGQYDKCFDVIRQISSINPLDNIIYKIKYKIITELNLFFQPSIRDYLNRLCDSSIDEIVKSKMRYLIYCGQFYSGNNFFETVNSIKHYTSLMKSDDPDRIEMEQLLVFIYIEQKKYADAVDLAQNQSSYLEGTNQLYKNQSKDIFNRILSYAKCEKGNYEESKRLIAEESTLNGKFLKVYADAKSGAVNSSIESFLPFTLNDKNILSGSMYSFAFQRLDSIYQPICNEYIQNATKFRNAGNSREAIRELSKAVRIADKETARLIYKTAFNMLKINPNLLDLSEEVRKNIVRADLYLKDQKHKQTIEEYESALDLMPFIPNLYSNLAIEYASTFYFDRAIEMMKIYLISEPGMKESQTAKYKIAEWEIKLENFIKDITT